MLEVDSLAWEITYATGPLAKGTLSRVQMAVLPECLRRLLNDSVKLMRRTRTRYEMTGSPLGSSCSTNRR